MNKKTEFKDIFSTKEREKIITYMLDNPEQRVRIGVLARKLKLSKGLISQYLRLLKSINFVKDNAGYLLNLENPIVRALKLMFNLKKINVKPFKKIDDLLGVGLYGSWAKGTNTPESDVDIWIKIKNHLPEEKIAQISADFRKQIGRVKITVLHPERLKRLKKEDPLFYHSLVFGSWLLWGEPLEV